MASAPLAVRTEEWSSEVFAQWAGPSVPAMTRLARRLAPGVDADDLVQEALTRAWVKLHLFDDTKGTASSWLLAILADQARKARRENQRHLKFFDRMTELPDSAAETGDTAGDLDVERALEKLPPRQRLAVDCHYFVGLSVVETAAVMKCSTGTVKSTLHDARGRLRLLLGEAS